MNLDNAIMVISFFIPIAAGYYLKKKKRLDSPTACFLIITLGMLLRLMYISYTAVDVRQHDVHGFFENNAGHSEYICYLLENKHLPDFDPRNIFQFYHPPLHHIICALWLGAAQKMGIPLETTAVDSLQLLTVTYSVLFCVFAYKSLKLLDLKPSSLELCTALVTFHPTMIIMSGSLNNDMLSSLFGMTAIYFTIKWAKEKKWKDIILIAFSVGLGMFTKLSVGLLAPAIAAVFLYIFIVNIKDFKKYILQFTVFGLICIPIGMYWPVRNYLKFEVPITYIPLLPENSGQYIDKTAAERLFNWLPFQFASPFTQWKWNNAPYDEFNPIIALWKNAMFDEGTFFYESITLQSFCTALFLVWIMISLYSTAALFFMWFKNRSVKRENKIFITIISAFIFINYITFCLKYPHVCTQNMRYCVPLIFTSAALIGMYLDNTDSMNKSVYLKSALILKRGTWLFCGLSSFVYIAMLFDNV